MTEVLSSLDKALCVLHDEMINLHECNKDEFELFMPELETRLEIIEDLLTDAIDKINID